MSSHNNPLAYVKMDSYANEKIQQLEKLHSSIITAIMYTYDDYVFYSYAHYLQPHMDIEAFLDSEEPLKSYPFGTIYKTCENPFTRDIGLVIPIVFELDERLNERVIFLISVNKLTKMIESYYMEFFDDITIKADNIVIHHTGPVDYEYGKEIPSKLKIKGENYIVKTTSMPYIDWNIIMAKNTNDLTAKMQDLSWKLIFVMISLLMVAYIVIMYNYSRFRRPFDQLSTLMEKNGESLSYAHFTYPGKNEIGQLGSHYNDMIDEIESLFLELKEKLEEVEEERAMKEWEQGQKIAAELKALQAQINPHFLYNALNSIVWTAQNHNDEEIKEMTLKLANFYKIGLSNGEDFITLRKELEHASNYLWIQCRRYDMIHYSFHIEDKSLLDMHVPKVILQPLIENAIYHGIKGTGKDGNITITLKREQGHISLKVSNDGRPIEDDVMKTINENLKAGIIHPQSGYGIYNVNNRIKLSYGQKWGLQLECDGTITASTITLPEEIKEQWSLS